MKGILFFLFFLFSFDGFSQIRFSQPPDTTYFSDSVRYEVKSGSYYSYFSHAFDSLQIDDSNLLCRQYVVLDIINKCGYLIIEVDSQVLMKYDIRKNKIEGIGVRYYVGVSNRIWAQSLFRDNKLDGVTSFYGDNGVITGIVLYKKGKYVKYIYHQVALDRDALKRGNKKAKDPFVKRKIVLH